MIQVISWLRRHPASTSHNRAFLLLVLWCVISCGHVDPSEYSLLARAENPGHTRQAMLIRHRSKAALSGDTYFVDIRAAGSPTDPVSLSHVYQTTPALYATRAESLTFAWSSDSQVSVICTRCGMDTIDVIRWHTQVGGSTVSFHGLPRHDAFGRSLPLQ
jgi:hypothetical protein